MPEAQPEGYSPTIKKRALSRRLREAREALGLTTSEVCKQLSWSPTRLNYIEHAKWVKPATDAVIDLCELYGLEGRERERLIKLARDARQRGWWRKYNDVFTNELPGFEAGASQIQTFESTFVPGLLQVRGYIELVTRAAGIEDPDGIRRHVDARIERQKILTRDEDPCQMHAIIDESAILRISNDEIRAEQLLHLLDMTELSNVTVQLLLIADGVYPTKSSEPFVYLRFPDSADRDIVYLETTVDDRMLEERDELEIYAKRFSRLINAACDPDRTRKHLKQQIE
jgi:transcriptional regulator with XRE-family HTH domain